MNTQAFKRRLVINGDSIGLTVLLLLSFQALANEWSVDHVVFSALAAGITFSLLRVYGFFNSIRYLPKPTDVAFLPTAMIPAGMAASILVATVTGSWPVEFVDLILGGSVYGAIVFAAYYSLNYLHLRNDKRTDIVLKLLPDEQDQIVAQFRACGHDRFVRFLSMSEGALRILADGGKGIDLIVFSRGAVKEMQADRLLVRAHLAGIPIIDRRRMSAELTGFIPTSDIDLWTYVTGATQQTSPLRAYTFAKVLVEPVVAGLLLIALSPLLAIIAAVIKLTSAGPVFYVQRRAGYLGRSFNLIKFRSMRTDSEAGGAKWATKNDDRTTPVGRFIRKVRLDELPQLFNVVKGEMSFIGPRPERPEFCRELEKSIPLFSMRTDVRPGITGWAQVCAGYAASVEESRVKLEHDLYYIQHMSPRLDLLVVFKTLKVMIMGNEYKDTRTALAPAPSPSGGGGGGRGPRGPES